MWKEISNDKDIASFMDTVCFFHDSCIKELKYYSGAYVTETLAMYPINDHRVLRILIQRQTEDSPVIEMEFEELKYLKLLPIGSDYTCEILDSTMFIKDNCIFWCDDGSALEKRVENYEGTIICASKLRWRSIDNALGKREFYVPAR